MKYIKFLWLLLPLLSSGQKKDRQPNILLIVSDDQGYGDFGFTGNKIVSTPHLDRLSAEAALYTHFMVGPACTPTRASLLTGRNHLDTGVWGVGSRGKVHRDETMLPKFFNPSGYHTWAFGKMDGGLQMMELNPKDRGFDYFNNNGGGGKCTSPFPGYCHRTEKGWVAELITDAALKKIKSADDEPWLMLMSYIIPHLPWYCPESYAEPFREKGYSEDLAQCYGSIKQMDDQIGRLLKILHEKGQAENTIVLFMSDNGPVDAVSNRERIVWQNQKNKNVHTDDWQLRNPDKLIVRKGEVWDNGIRSPLLVRWPGKITPGIRKQAIGVEDLLPTLIDLAQIPEKDQPKHLPFYGQSFRASLEDLNAVDARVVFRLASGGPGTPSAEMDIIPDANMIDYSQLHTVLQSGNYKFHHLPNDKLSLYDIWKDPRELNDLSEIMPEKTLELSRRCRTEWGAIAKRNRTFPARQLCINNKDKPSAGRWLLPACHGLNFAGEMERAKFGLSLLGFRYPGDTATYEVEVQKSLKVSVVLRGKNLDKCAPIDLQIDGEIIQVKHRSAAKIEYSPMKLSKGKIPFRLLVNAHAKAGTHTGEIAKIIFNKSKK